MFSVWVILLIAGCSIEAEDQTMSEFPVQKTDAEWQEDLTPEQYRILRKAGTERPFSGAYNDHEEAGTYHCAGCDAVLFTSDSKFHSGCGWPAFDQAVADERVVERKDVRHGMIRTEVLCANCGGHLGHVFNDGPAVTTGLRYCINSVALRFNKE